MCNLQGDWFLMGERSEHFQYKKGEGERRKDGDMYGLQTWDLWNLEVEDVACQVRDKVIL